MVAELDEFYASLSFSVFGTCTFLLGKTDLPPLSPTHTPRGSEAFGIGRWGSIVIEEQTAMGNYGWAGYPEL